MTSIPNPSLAAGEAALNQGDYSTAIAHLEAICEIELDETIISRAQQALMVAYTNSGEIRKAIALCQELKQSPTDKDWASKTLADLAKRYPEALSPETSDFTSPKGTTSGTKTPSRDKKDLLPVTYTKPSTEAEVFTPGRQWRNAERAKRWKPMKPMKLRRLWLIELATIIALFWVFRLTIEYTVDTINNILVKLPYIRPIQFFYEDKTWFLGILLIILLITSPWLLDWLLKWFYGLESLSLPQLASQNPESARVLQKFCRKKHIKTPKLGILPIYAPIAINYGHLPHNARIIISEGLLEKLDDQELATIYASQLGQIINGDFLWMSGIITLLQIPFTLYWQTAKLGEGFYHYLKTRFRKPSKFIPGKIWIYIPSLVRGIMAIIAAGFYGLYWLWRVPVLWFSRWRCYYSDRFAAELTGNPNALCRALLKIAIGIAEQVQFQSHTNWILEGFDLMMPIGHRQVISVGSLPDYTTYKSVLAWECSNPYRHWLALVNSHPLLGDRLYLLGRYAYFWKIEPELDLPSLRPPPRDNGALFEKVKKCYQALPVLQSAFLSAFFFGIVLRCFFWLVGRVGDYLNIWQLIWLHNAHPFFNAWVGWVLIVVILLTIFSLKRSFPDIFVFFVLLRTLLWLIGIASPSLDIRWLHWLNNADPLLTPWVLFAFSLSIIIWINGYFPDIKITPTRNDPRLQDLLSDPDTVPPKSDGVRLTGKLLGREGISNWLVQDLMLQTSTGLVKLHFFSWLGPIGNLFPWFSHPNEFIDREVTVFGWFRRGSTPWIDVDTLRIKNGKTIRTGYPIWLTILAVGSAFLSAYLVIQA
ncbi:MAG: M48 family metalloprotease [Moorea sp. SIO2B7]|nr:M48 family metalloprotease [Moorena sp. SIO2B7]